MSTTLKRAAIAALVAVLSVIVLGAGVTASSAAGAAPTGSLRPFTTAELSGRAVTGVPLAIGHATAPAPAPGVTAYLTVFQEASTTPLAVSIDGGTPIILSNGTFAYGLVPAGIHTVTAQGGLVNVSGSVTVQAGTHETAVLYLAPGAVPALTSFTNDSSAPPVGQSRLAIRNLANTLTPVDVYVDGNLVAPGLANTPSAPTSVTVTVPSGPTSIAVTPAGTGLNTAFKVESGQLGGGDLLNVFVVGNASATPSTASLFTNLVPLASGYRLYASDGGVFDFGSATFHGSTGGVHLNQPVVGAAPTVIGLGYWLAAADGGIFSFGDASFFGSAGSLPLVKPIVGVVSTPDQKGYWLAASDGGVFSYGDAGFYGSAGSLKLNKPIVGIAATPDGKGYWLVASDGGVFSFGDAAFYGSTGNLSLVKPIVGIAPTVDGYGYWLVASDGGVFAAGDATFYGSTGGLPLNKPVVAVVPTPDSLGYWLVASDGGIFSFGNAHFFGSTGALALQKPIVAATTPGLSIPS